jgi:hypothetical protein
VITFAIAIGIILVGAYLYLALFALLRADSFMFRPPRTSYRDGPRILKIPAADGTPISAVHFETVDPVATVFFLHGNSEDLGDIMPRLEEMQARGYSVLAFDYRGYGTTPGRPTAAAVVSDALDVMRHLVERIGVPAQSVLLYGRSLGGGPAVEIARRHAVAALVLEGVFLSAFRVVTRVRVLPWDRFPVAAQLDSVRSPVLVIHAIADETVPFCHGEKLYSRAREPKARLWVDGAGHNNLVEVAGDAFWAALADILPGRKSGS